VKKVATCALSCWGGCWSHWKCRRAKRGCSIAARGRGYPSSILCKGRGETQPVLGSALSLRIIASLEESAKGSHAPLGVGGRHKCEPWLSVWWVGVKEKEEKEEQE
jgi:hypothetical protein